VPLSFPSRARALLAASLLAAPVLAADIRPPLMPAPVLELHLVVTAQARQLFSNWARSTGQPFTVVPVQVAERGQSMSAVLLFGGCKPNAVGDCDVEVDIVAHAPDGSVYGQMQGAELWVRKPAPLPGNSQLGVSYMAIVIEPQDAAGTYRVTAVARDRNARTEARSSASFEVR